VVLPDDGVPRTRTVNSLSNISASLLTVFVRGQVPSRSLSCARGGDDGACSVNACGVEVATIDNY